jgi:hypothetical protein
MTISIGHSATERVAHVPDADCITNYREALELRPLGHPDRSETLINLATALRTRFEQDADRADLNDCITKYEEALELTPHGHPLRSTSLRSLALALSILPRDITTAKPTYVLPPSPFA